MLNAGHSKITVQFILTLHSACIDCTGMSEIAWTEHDIFCISADRHYWIEKNSNPVEAFCLPPNGLALTPGRCIGKFKTLDDAKMFCEVHMAGEGL